MHIEVISTYNIYSTLDTCQLESPVAMLSLYISLKPLHISLKTGFALNLWFLLEALKSQDLSRVRKTTWSSIVTCKYKLLYSNTRQQHILLIHNLKGANFGQSFKLAVKYVYNEENKCDICFSWLGTIFINRVQFPL